MATSNFMGGDFGFLRAFCDNSWCIPARISSTTCHEQELSTPMVIKKGPRDGSPCTFQPFSSDIAVDDIFEVFLFSAVDFWFALFCRKIAQVFQGKLTLFKGLALAAVE